MATQTRGETAQKRAKSGGPAKGGRTSPALFIRQVIAELRKVIWPTRQELRTYTIVALTFVLVMVVIVTIAGLRVHQAGVLGVRLSQPARARWPE